MSCHKSCSFCRHQEKQIVQVYIEHPTTLFTACRAVHSGIYISFLIPPPFGTKLLSQIRKNSRNSRKVGGNIYKIPINPENEIRTVTHNTSPVDSGEHDPALFFEATTNSAIAAQMLQETFMYDYLTVGDASIEDLTNIKKAAVFQKTVLILNRKKQIYDVEYAIVCDTTYFKSFKKYESPEFGKMFGFDGNCTDFVKGKIIVVRRKEESKDDDRIVQHRYSRWFSYVALTVNTVDEEDMLIFVYQKAKFAACERMCICGWENTSARNL